MRNLLTVTAGIAFIVACGADATPSSDPPEASGDGKGATGGDPTAEFTSCADTTCAPAPPEPSAPVVCGDGIVSDGEACDDRNQRDGDGCSADCTHVEAGWRCPTPGLACEAASCGDGIVVGREECDFEGAPIAGCSATCKIEPGYECDVATLTCTPTLCGDGKVSRGETCEDGNSLPFDGCFRCQKEPKCTNGVCAAVCGDGQRFATEACDDGNNRDGDGCSADCKVEHGYTCADEPAANPPATLDLPVLVRDFIGKDLELDGASYHEDFNGHGIVEPLGIVEDVLGADGLPVYSCPNGDCDQNPGHLALDGSGRPNTSTKANFDQWFRDAPGVNLTSSTILTLRRENDSYVFDSANKAHNSGRTDYDPIGTGGWPALGKESRTCGNRDRSFTSETRFWFEYKGGERFDFSGDDDVWVFLNGRLAIDLGGVHPPRTGYFVLDDDNDGAGPDTADGTGLVFSEEEGVERSVDFQMVVGGIYEVVAFQAERQNCGSNFKLTLRDFNRPKSTCASTCGDGIVASDEVCDDGINDGRYGGCMPGCKARGPFCGDGKVDPDHEQCDDGNEKSDDACSNICRTQVIK